MDTFPSGDFNAARADSAPRFTTAKVATLAVASLTMFAGLAACSSDDNADSGATAESSSAAASESTSTTGATDNSSLVNGESVPGLGQVPTLTLTVDDTYAAAVAPLESEAAPFPFVQGLEFEADGSLLVGTGQYDESQIYRLPQWLSNPATEAADVNNLAPELFGEGITRHGDSIWQLTWKEGRAIERDATTLEQRRDVPLDTEGWGACSFEDTIVTSDGTGTLTFRSTEDLSPQKQLKVTAADQDTTWLNELECAPAGSATGAAGAGDTTPSGQGEIWANVWQSPFIYRIDAGSGEVTGIVDARQLYWDLLSRIDAAQIADLDVMNGIALIPQDVQAAPGEGAASAAEAVPGAEGAEGAAAEGAEGAEGTAAEGAEGAEAPAGSGRQFLLTGKKWPYAYRVTISE